MKIFVCSYNSFDLALAEENPSHIVSIIDPKTMLPPVKNVVSKNRLVLKFDDIVEKRLQKKLLQQKDIENLIQFLAKKNINESLLIHCMMGISRSTAAAYIALAMHFPYYEDKIALYLRKKIPYARPNILMVTYADILLGCNNRMIDAIENLEESNFQDTSQISCLDSNEII
jgi:predicted protein tyrosine phosphatase